VFQDFAYTFDPVSNVMAIMDSAPLTELHPYPPYGLGYVLKKINQTPMRGFRTLLSPARYFNAWRRFMAGERIKG